MTIDRTSIGVSTQIDQATRLAFKATDDAMEKLADDTNFELDAINTTLATVATTTGTLAQFAATTSAQLAGVISDETGTAGNLVFSSGPTIASPTITTSPTASGATWASLGTVTAATFTEGTFANGGLHILDTNASHDLIITPGSNLTADRVLTVTTGDAARTLTLTGDLTVTAATTLAGAASDTVAGPIEVAIQSEMEAATSITHAVTPARLFYHPSAVKFWVKFNSAGTIADDWNVSSVSDNGDGDKTVTILLDFSSTAWCAQACGGYITGDSQLIYNVASIAAGTVQIQIKKQTDGSNADPDTPDAIFILGIGDSV